MTNWEDEALYVVNNALVNEYGGWQAPAAEAVVRALSLYGLLREENY